MSENNYCPCCERHCDLNEPHCNRGNEYIRTGIVGKQEHTHKKSKNSCRTENYDTLDMNDKLIMNLRDLGHSIRFLLEGKGSQKRILIILYETGSMTQRELTERLKVQPGSASEVIGKLESAGFIKRTPSKEDRRTTDIELTEAGRKLAEETIKQRKIRNQEMFSCLSDEEKGYLLTLLEQLNKDWDSRYGEDDKRHGHHEGHRHHGHHHDCHNH